MTAPISITADVSIRKVVTKKHKYCDKFKWVIDRAKHYGEKLGIPWEDILDSWESHRDYWYMNYYQECNQPTILSGNVRVFDTVEDLRAAEFI